jgi:class 3 adenylate cyclase/tetratricopeptide (TPR) repeat protein
MTDVAKFLASLDLSQYAETFAQNDIDAAALVELGEEHLKELGVSLGHRIKLLKAIAGLRAQGVPVAVPEPAAAQRPVDGERRQVTVMFCDLVGSSELAARVDPEEMREVVQSYQHACAGVVARFEGHLAQFLGDGVLAYFGYPQAHEDAAERAVRAALGIVQAVARLPSRAGRRMRVRVGIATGLVVVGKVMSAEGASELSAIGETPNLAARLQAIAEPDSVVIGENTKALTRGSFRYADLGSLTVKGFRAPVRAWRVLGEASATRFEAAHTGGMSQFVGREQEVALLLSRWEQAAGGEGQAVLLCGEAGIGKSRIGEQFRQQLRDVAHTRVRYQCSPFHSSSALQPVIGQLEFAAGMNADDDNATRLAKLEGLLRPTTSRLSETLPLFASLLGITLDERYPMPQLTADAIKRRTLEALADQLVALSRSQPVYWQVEDAHWIDPTTRELIGLCLPRMREARVFVLITYRPDFASPWGNMPHVTALTLNRLARRSSVELVEQLAGGRSLPAEVLDQILAKTEGIPLFIEELTKTVLESGLLAERGGRYVLTGALPPMAIPATLQDSLMARLERLSPVKEVAQIGAAIGREFTYDLLSTVAPMPAAELDKALAQLAAAELVYVRGEPPDATYIFKHALVQDAAYASLLRVRRHQLHSRIAEALQDKFPDAVARRPELLALHYGAAGLDAKAQAYWARAGKQAMERSEYPEAASHFANALALLRKSPDREARRREEADLVLDQAVTVQALKGHGSVESKAVAEEAVQISAPLGDDPLHFRARWADWVYNSISGNLPVAAERADRLVEMAKRLGQVDLKLQAYHARWTTANLRGDVAVACEDVEQGLALYDLEKHRGHWAIYGAHDPGVCARATGSCVLWQAGFTEKAARIAADAVRLSDELGHPFTRTVARWIAGFHSIMAGDAVTARALADSMIEIAEEAKLSQQVGFGKLIAGWATSRLDELGRGTEQMEAIYRKFVGAKQRGFLTLPGTVIAAAKLEMGRVEDALNFLDELQQLAVETHQQMFISDLHRLRAEALRRLDPRDPRIEEEYGRALHLARAQGARMLELRAAAGFVSWMAASDRHREGHRLLKPIYERMPEGLASPELQAAKALLGQLG